MVMMLWSSWWLWWFDTKWTLTVIARSSNKISLTHATSWWPTTPMFWTITFIHTIDTKLSFLAICQEGKKHKTQPPHKYYKVNKMRHVCVFCDFLKLVNNFLFYLRNLVRPCGKSICPLSHKQLSSWDLG